MGVIRQDGIRSTEKAEGGIIGGLDGASNRSLNFSKDKAQSASANFYRSFLVQFM